MILRPLIKIDRAMNAHIDRLDNDPYSNKTMYISNPKERHLISNHGNLIPESPFSLPLAPQQ